MRRLIATVLASEEHDVRETSTGEDALEELTRSRPDLLILDLYLPGQDGLAVLDAIRKDPGLAATRVLLVSGTTDALDDHWAETVGADAHLSKPFGVEALKRTVATLLA